jgi:hypothetical protein
MALSACSIRMAVVKLKFWSGNKQHMKWTLLNLSNDRCPKNFQLFAGKKLQENEKEKMVISHSFHKHNPWITVMPYQNSRHCTQIIHANQHYLYIHNICFVNKTVIHKNNNRPLVQAYHHSIFYVTGLLCWLPGHWGGISRTVERNKSKTTCTKTT